MLRSGRRGGEQFGVLCGIGQGGTGKATGNRREAMTDVTVVPAHAGDMDIVEALLVREHLPLDGLREHPQHMFVARAGDRVIGCASIELYGDAALLRSVVVAGEYRRDGVGESLVRAALRLAERSSVSSVFLLTTTAEHFFPRFGFTVVDRADVPPAVRASAEFARACPSSAIIMRKSVIRDS